MFELDHTFWMGVCRKGCASRECPWQAPDWVRQSIEAAPVRHNIESSAIPGWNAPIKQGEIEM
jgi:hypothetical protein